MLVVGMWVSVIGCLDCCYWFLDWLLFLVCFGVMVFGCLSLACWVVCGWVATLLVVWLFEYGFVGIVRHVAVRFGCLV